MNKLLSYIYPVVALLAFGKGIATYFGLPVLQIELVAVYVLFGILLTMLWWEERGRE